MLEQLESYWPHFIASNAIALGVLWLAWKRPFAARMTFGGIFLLACFANTWMAVTNPADYLNYREFVWLEFYRWFIDRFMTDFARPLVLCVAAGQLAIAIGMFVNGRLLKPAIVGAVIFGLAIAPLGVGSGFPCSVLLALAAALLWRRGNVARTD